MTPDSQPDGTAEATPTDEVGANGDGQGQSGIEGLYDLSSAPEELRPQLQEHLKQIDGNVTRKFQEYSERLKPFEAFEDIQELKDVEPDDLRELLAFREVASDPEQFEQWWEQIGVQLGFLEGGEDTEQADGVDDGDEPAWATELRERLDAIEGQTKEQQTEAERAERVQAAKADLDSKLKTAFETNNLDLEDENVVNTVLRFAKDYVDSEDDPIARAVEDYLQLTGRAQSELVTDRLGQPAAAMSGGRAPTSEAEPKTFKEAKAAAMQRIGAGG